MTGWRRKQPNDDMSQGCIKAVKELLAHGSTSHSILYYMKDCLQYTPESEKLISESTSTFAK
jgi:hypothetical protein